MLLQDCNGGCVQEKCKYKRSLFEIVILMTYGDYSFVCWYYNLGPYITIQCLKNEGDVLFISSLVYVFLDRTIILMSTFLLL